MRWLESLADTPIEIVYRPGPNQVVPDGLSRLGLTTPSDVGSDPTDVSTILVEPTFLARVSEATFSDTSPAIRDVVRRARGTDDSFRIEIRGNV